MSRARFIIRWDDVSPFQDSQKYHSLIDLFKKHNVPAVLGVIPDNRDEEIHFESRNETEFVEELKGLEKLGWEIAQHGYRHLKHNDDGGILNLNKASEFSGRSYEDQINDIEKGRKILNDYGFHPVTFIPPWHSYDKLTIEALSSAGFKVLLDGLFLFPRMTGSLMQLPQLLWSVPHQIKNLDKAGSVYTICLHPHLVTNDDMATLDRFLSENGAKMVTASALIDEAPQLTRRGIKKRMIESLFKLFYKRHGS